MSAELPFRVLVFTDAPAAAVAGRTVAETVRACLPACDARVAFALRDKTAPLHEIGDLVRGLRGGLQQTGARLLLHTQADLATALDVDGVHMPDDAPAPALGPTLRGCSRHAGAPLDVEDLAGFAYATISPVFAPTSKPDDDRPRLGLDGLREHAERSARPVVALGGVTPDNAGACLDAGAAAVAVLGGVMSAPDPAAALRALLDAVGDA